MAANNHHQSNKRKRISNAHEGKPHGKKSKPTKTNPLKVGKQSSKLLQPSKAQKVDAATEKTPSVPVKNGEDPKKDRRVVSKELTEARKKKRKPHFNLQQELALLWEKMRRRNIAKEERSKLITDALRKMKGKIPEIAGSHVSSRVLQTCIKYCLPQERGSVFVELQPHLLNLSRNTYAIHLVKKMLDCANKKQLDGFFSSLRGHVASLLRHPVGSAVVEHAFQLGNGTQKRGLLLEMYSTEFVLFKDLVSMSEGRLMDLIPKLGLKKSSVLEHMAAVLQPILEKGIVDHSIIHNALMEYLSIADKASVTDVIQQLSGPLLVRMIHTREGSKVGVLCVKHGSAKERKKIIKGMKGHVGKIAHDQYGSMVLSCVLSVVDDTKLITKIILRELQPILKELILDKNGRHPLLQLLHPHCPRYFRPDDLAVLNISVPSLSNEAISEIDQSARTDVENNVEVSANDIDENTSPEEIQCSAEGSKKDPFLRRVELLINSGLAEGLIQTCIESAGELVRSNFGKEVIYEVATGGFQGILLESFAEKLNTLHEAISALGVHPKTEESEEEHVFVNFHSSRLIRKLVLSCSSFAVTLWNLALKGKCEMWAQGHSCKVVSAFMESSDPEVRNLVKPELQPLIDSGKLKIQGNKQLDAET